MHSPAPFSQTWSLADTKLRLDQPKFPSKGSATEQQAWRKEVGDPFHKKISIHIGRHIAWAMQSGTQVVPAFCEHTRVRVIEALKSLQADPQSEQAQLEAGDRFAHQMEIAACFFGHADKVLDPDDVHDRLVSVVEEGEFNLASDGGPCALSGVQIHVLFDGWKGVAATMELTCTPNLFRSHVEFTPLVAGQIKPQGAEMVSLPMPTGELLIADWFRIPAFNALSKAIDEASDEDHDIGAIAGRATRTRRYANELGVGHVGCGSPAILQDEGVVKFGFLDANASQPKSFKGELCADLRWTTLVDRGHLVDLLAAELGHDEARRQVDDYLRETREVIRVSVDPGTHHLYFAGSAQVFGQTISAQFQADGLYLEDFEDAAFALTKDALQPVVALDPSAPRKLPHP